MSLFWIVGAILTLQVPPPQSAEKLSADLRREHRAIQEAEAAKLKELADRLQGKGDSKGDQEVRSLIPAALPADGPTHFVPLPEVIPAPAKGLANVPAAGPPTAPWR